MTTMPDEFFEWLDQCPVQWFRIGDDPENLTYEFAKPEEEQE